MKAWIQCVAAVLACVILIAVLWDDGKPYSIHQRCVHSHIEAYTGMFLLGGKIPIPFRGTTEVCDKYEKYLVRKTQRVLRPTDPR